MLYTCADGLGHLHPMIPFARAARRAGHEVAFAIPPGGVALVERLGFPALPAGEHRAGPEVFPEGPHLRGVESQLFWLSRWFAGVMAERLAADLLDLADTWRPDLIVRESTAFGACVAAERLGIPHASVTINVVAREDRRAVLRGPLDRLRTMHGLPSDPDLQMLDRYLTLIPSPPTLYGPDPLLARTAHFIRPAPFDQSGTEELPPYLAHGQQAPLVYATLGTAPRLANEGALYRAIIAAFEGVPATAIVTVGRHGDPEQFRDRPANVDVERYIPQSLLFGRCDLVVAHAGSGTTMGALCACVPMVMLPMGADQPANAARCEALGVARTLEPWTATPDTIRAAMFDVLGDHRFRERARCVQAEITAMPGMARAVELFEQLVTSQAPLHR